MIFIGANKLRQRVCNQCINLHDKASPVAHSRSTQASAEADEDCENRDSNEPHHDIHYSDSAQLENVDDFIPNLSSPVHTTPAVTPTCMLDGYSYSSHFHDTTESRILSSPSLSPYLAYDHIYEGNGQNSSETPVVEHENEDGSFRLSYRERFDVNPDFQSAEGEMKNPMTSSNLKFIPAKCTPRRPLQPMSANKSTIGMSRSVITASKARPSLQLTPGLRRNTSMRLTPAVAPSSPASEYMIPCEVHSMADEFALEGLLSKPSETLQSSPIVSPKKKVSPSKRSPEVVRFHLNTIEAINCESMSLRPVSPKSNLRKRKSSDKRAQSFFSNSILSLYSPLWPSLVVLILVTVYAGMMRGYSAWSVTTNLPYHGISLNAVQTFTSPTAAHLELTPQNFSLAQANLDWTPENFELTRDISTDPVLVHQHFDQVQNPLFLQDDDISNSNDPLSQQDAVAPTILRLESDADVTFLPVEAALDAKGGSFAKVALDAMGGSVVKVALDAQGGSVAEASLDSDGSTDASTNEPNFVDDNTEFENVVSESLGATTHTGGDSISLPLAPATLKPPLLKGRSGIVVYVLMGSRRAVTQWSTKLRGFFRSIGNVLFGILRFIGAPKSGVR